MHPACLAPGPPARIPSPGGRGRSVGRTDGRTGGLGGRARSPFREFKSRQFLRRDRRRVLLRLQKKGPGRRTRASPVSLACVLPDVNCNCNLNPLTQGGWALRASHSADRIGGTNGGHASHQEIVVSFSFALQCMHIAKISFVVGC